MDWSVKRMDATTLSTKYQVVIPKAVRERQRFQPGQRFVVVEKGDVVALVPIRESNDLRGILQGADPQDYRDRSDLE